MGKPFIIRDAASFSNLKNDLGLGQLIIGNILILHHYLCNIVIPKDIYKFCDNKAYMRACILGISIIMSMIDKEKKKAFLEKHPPLTPEEVRQKEIDRDASIQKYRKDIERAEENLMNYLKKEDPLVDPATDKAIAWLRRLPIEQFYDLMPPEVFKAYRMALEGNIEDAKAVMEQYADYMYKLMAKMVSRPSWTEEEWKERANMEFIALFNARLSELMSRLEEQTDFL